MAHIGYAVREIVSQSIGVISPLSDSRQVLSFHKGNFGFGKVRMHYSIGENRPGGIENLRTRSNSEHRPVRARSDYDLTSQERHRASERILGVPLGAALGDLEQDWLYTCVRLSHLPGSAQQVEVRCDDIIGVVLPEDNVHPGYIEARRGGRQRHRN